MIIPMYPKAPGFPFNIKNFGVSYPKPQKGNGIYIPTRELHEVLVDSNHLLNSVSSYSCNMCMKISPQKKNVA